MTPPFFNHSKKAFKNKKPTRNQSARALVRHKKGFVGTGLRVVPAHRTHRVRNLWQEKKEIDVDVPWLGSRFFLKVKALCGHRISPGRGGMRRRRLGPFFSTASRQTVAGFLSVFFFRGQKRGRRRLAAKTIVIGLSAKDGTARFAGIEHGDASRRRAPKRLASKDRKHTTPPLSGDARKKKDFFFSIPLFFFPLF